MTNISKAGFLVLICAFLVLTVGSIATSMAGNLYSYYTYTYTNQSFAGSTNYVNATNSSVVFTTTSAVDGTDDKLILHLLSNHTANTTVNITWDGTTLASNVAILTYGNVTYRTNSYNYTGMNLTSGNHTLKIYSNVENEDGIYMLNTTSATNGNYLYYANVRTTNYVNNGYAIIGLFSIIVMIMIVAVILIVTSRVK